MGENMEISNIFAIDNNGNEIELGKGITEIKSIEDLSEENFYIGIEPIEVKEGDFTAPKEDEYFGSSFSGTLSIDIKNKKITKRKMIKLFMAEGFDRNTAIKLYNLYLCNIGKRTTLGYMIFKAMCAVKEV